MRYSRRVRRLLLALGACLTLAASPGCLAVAPSRLRADRAFALSASALSGRDEYVYRGERSLRHPDGRQEQTREYKGRVSGHRPVALEWDGRPATRATAVPAHPLELAEAVQLRSAAIDYEPSPERGTVAFRIELRPEEARRLAVRELAGMRKLPAEALSSLQANTVCVWVADKRTWFPKRLSEETAIRYMLDGELLELRSVSRTDFQ